MADETLFVLLRLIKYKIEETKIVFYYFDPDSIEKKTLMMLYKIINIIVLFDH
ncbi:MAG: hypothetical protein NTX22_17315 [Ignavibacteriales bacterium]|nr:hypothetical protein [Ignavibacteriales bacterium]